MENIKVSEMVRITSQNTSEFLVKIAEHIEHLEATIEQLTARLQELEKNNEA